MNLERAQLGLLAALAATIPVSIFASEAILALSLAVLAARLATGRAHALRTPLDTPLVALVVWAVLLYRRWRERRAIRRADRPGSPSTPVPEPPASP